MEEIYTKEAAIKCLEEMLNSIKDFKQEYTDLVNVMYDFANLLEESNKQLVDFDPNNTDIYEIDLLQDYLEETEFSNLDSILYMIADSIDWERINDLLDIEKIDDIEELIENIKEAIKIIKE